MPALIIYDTARQALAAAVRVDEAKSIRDKALAMQVYAQQAKDPELINHATEIRLRAEIRAGEILREMAERGERQKPGDAAGGNGRTVLPLPTPRLADLGVSKTQSSRWQQLAAMPKDVQEAKIEAAKKTALAAVDRPSTDEKRERRAERERALANQQIQDPIGKFGVMVEDFEWDHETWSEAGRDRAAENHYPVSRDAHTAAEIVEHTKDRFACAADDCICFMWSTLQHAAIAMDVLRMRGFEYKSQYAWGKDKIGLGYWSREKHEILLIGVKGDVPCPAPGSQWDSLVMAPRGEHSAKPECFLEMIEQYFPTMPKIELNRRGPARPGWSAWGNQAGIGADRQLSAC